MVHQDVVLEIIRRNCRINRRKTKLNGRAKRINKLLTASSNPSFPSQTKMVVKRKILIPQKIRIRELGSDLPSSEKILSTKMAESIEVIKNVETKTVTSRLLIIGSGKKEKYLKIEL